MFKPRPAQAAVLRYRSGKMGVAAVPGSGKTQVLSCLAADLIAEGALEDDQEVLVVTLVNSAVSNFAHRIEGFIKERRMLPRMGYRVRTLHGLANDILRERPDLAGLPNHFQIVDDLESERILLNAARSWLAEHPQFIDTYENPEKPFSNLAQQQKSWEETVTDMARAFIGMSKDLELTPEDLRLRMDALEVDDDLLSMGLAIYTDYQRSLANQAAIDFADLIRLALQSLRMDADFLERMRRRFPYILEDEAQDSSRLQECMLSLLCGPEGNWVRMGDPNQAIYETFTTASPHYLLDFRNRPDVLKLDLPNSGRSTRKIIKLANHLVDWSINHHPNPQLCDALNPPYIQPTPHGDPQENPKGDTGSIFLSDRKHAPDEELRIIVKSLSNYLQTNPDCTVAVMSTSNARGAKLATAFRDARLQVVELLRTSESTRRTAQLITCVLRCLAMPESSPLISLLYKEMHLQALQNDETRDKAEQVIDLLRRCRHVEDFIAPFVDHDWLEELARKDTPAELLDELFRLRNLLRRWQQASLLPIDQLVLTISGDLFSEPADLALAHKLALLLENTARAHPDFGLFEFAQDLDEVVKNKRKMLGFADEDTGFDPDAHRGKVVVSTMHRAKGLEWDRVYLTSVNTYDFPSGFPYESYISEKWYIRGQLNLPAEIIARLKALAVGDVVGLNLEEGEATRMARRDYSAERLRLLYVGITRARRDLCMTWNTGKQGREQQSMALEELCRFWQEAGDGVD